jgi:hypothetical protein
MPSGRMSVHSLGHEFGVDVHPLKDVGPGRSARDGAMHDDAVGMPPMTWASRSKLAGEGWTGSKKKLLSICGPPSVPSSAPSYSSTIE